MVPSFMNACGHRSHDENPKHATKLTQRFPKKKQACTFRWHRDYYLNGTEHLCYKREGETQPPLAKSIRRLIQRLSRRFVKYLPPCWGGLNPLKQQQKEMNWLYNVYTICLFVCLWSHGVPTVAPAVFFKKYLQSKHLLFHFTNELKYYFKSSIYMWRIFTPFWIFLHFNDATQECTSNYLYNDLLICLPLSSPAVWDHFDLKVSFSYKKGWFSLPHGGKFPCLTSSTGYCTLYHDDR